MLKSSFQNCVDHRTHSLWILINILESLEIFGCYWSVNIQFLVLFILMYDLRVFWSQPVIETSHWSKDGVFFIQYCVKRDAVNMWKMFVVILCQPVSEQLMLAWHSDELVLRDYLIHHNEVMKLFIVPLLWQHKDGHDEAQVTNTFFNR